MTIMTLNVRLNGSHEGRILEKLKNIIPVLMQLQTFLICEFCAAS